jgi:hypothetical protein
MEKIVKPAVELSVDELENVTFGTDDRQPESRRPEVGGDRARQIERS